MDTSWTHLSAPDLGGDAWLGYAAKARGEVTSLLDNMARQRQKQQEIEDARYNADMGVELQKWEKSLEQALGEAKVNEDARHNLAVEAETSSRNKADQDAKKIDQDLKRLELQLKGTSKGSDGSSNSSAASLSNNRVRSAIDAARDIEKRYNGTMDFDLSDVGKEYRRTYSNGYNKLSKFWHILPQQMRDQIARELSQDSYWSRTDSTQAYNVNERVNNLWDQFLMNIAENYGDLRGARETLRLANTGLLENQLAQNAGYARQAGLLGIMKDLEVSDEILNKMGYSTQEIANVRNMLAQQVQSNTNNTTSNRARNSF